MKDKLTKKDKIDILLQLLWILLNFSFALYVIELIKQYIDKFLT